jgi:hypothetical protein
MIRFIVADLQRAAALAANGDAGRAQASEATGV